MVKTPAAAAAKAAGDQLISFSLTGDIVVQGIPLGVGSGLKEPTPVLVSHVCAPEEQSWSWGLECWCLQSDSGSGVGMLAVPQQ